MKLLVQEIDCKSDKSMLTNRVLLPHLFKTAISASVQIWYVKPAIKRLVSISVCRYFGHIFLTLLSNISRLRTICQVLIYIMLYQSNPINSSLLLEENYLDWVGLDRILHCNIDTSFDKTFSMVLVRCNSLISTSQSILKHG